MSDRTRPWVAGAVLVGVLVIGVLAGRAKQRLTLLVSACSRWSAW
jgi:hypothetical protein